MSPTQQLRRRASPTNVNVRVEAEADAHAVEAGAHANARVKAGTRAENRCGSDGEQAARQSLRLQVARLERRLSNVVAGGFPHVRPLGGEHPSGPDAPARAGGPRLLSLGELERLRDGLAARVEQAERQAGGRAELVRRSQLLLEEMKRDPRRHKFVRLAVVDLGQGSCGAWEVRPRLGLIGMLAGWWQVKLSSGCP